MTDIDVVKLRADVDELQKQVQGLLKQAAAWRRAFDETNTNPTPAPIKPSQPSQPSQPNNLTALAEKFPPMLRKKLSFEKNGNNTAILRIPNREDKETFKQLATIVDQLHGAWVKDGANSRFEVPL